ncbi:MULTISPECIES: hypothetical protein [unclassified Micromonospora]|uniref:hypothetical protein n=1 Tax=unclassified Micromonospora TaxID=2617518 RepID=UPI00332CAEFB
MADIDLTGKWACRFCRHDQYTHNLIQGCVSCDCLATPGEAAPRTDAELDAPILPSGQVSPGYTARRRLSETVAVALDELNTTERETGMTVQRYEELTMPERAALNVWTTGSADTTGMLCAVRAALTAHDTTEDTRLALAEQALRDLLGMVDQFDTPRDPGRVQAFVGDVRQVALRGLGQRRG